MGVSFVLFREKGYKICHGCQNRSNVAITKGHFQIPYTTYSTDVGSRGWGGGEGDHPQCLESRSSWSEVKIKLLVLVLKYSCYNGPWTSNSPEH